MKKWWRHYTETFTGKILGYNVHARLEMFCFLETSWLNTFMMLSTFSGYIKHTQYAAGKFCLANFFAEQ